MKNIPYRLFLIDSLGALLSAIMLGLVLTRFENIFGMPSKILNILAAIPVGFAIYSMLCFVVKPQNWKPYLKAIALANLLYCCLTIGLMFYGRQLITSLGILYFVLEILVILILVRMERQTWLTAES